MKPFDKHNLENYLHHALINRSVGILDDLSSSMNSDEIHHALQTITHSMSTNLPMGYPPGFVSIGDRAHLVKDMLLQSQDIGTVKFTDAPNDLDNSNESIYYIHKDEKQKDKIGYTTDILVASDIGNLIISKDRLDEILLQYCMFAMYTTYPDLTHILTLYKSKDPYKYASNIQLISSYNKLDIELYYLDIQFQKFESVVPELENFVNYTNKVYQISNDIDDSPKKLSDIKTIISDFKIEISPAAYEFLKLEFSRGRIQICNTNDDDEYSIHIQDHHVYYSKLISLLKLPWKKKSSNIDSKRKLIELLKSNQYDDLVIPTDLIQSVVCILQDRTKV